MTTMSDIAERVRTVDVAAAKQRAVDALSDEAARHITCARLALEAEDLPAAAKHFELAAKSLRSISENQA